MLIKKEHIYHHDNIQLIGYAAHSDHVQGKRPAVLVMHDWTGRNALAQEKAEKLAEMGYVGFALDMYGEKKNGATKEEKAALMQPLMQDRSLLLKRILAALDHVRSLEHVDPHNIGAIGFCFGGLCALDLARSDADVKAVVSFHGLLGAPPHAKTTPMQTRILALHGYNDPMVTPQDVMTFANEMTARKAPWEIDMYGHTMHAFTNPQANDPGFGTVYNKQSAETAWNRMIKFFQLHLLNNNENL